MWRIAYRRNGEEMLIIAVDDELLMLKRLVDSIKEVEPDSTIVQFDKSTEALQYAKEHIIDVAFLDIQMRVMSGIELGKQMKLLNPKTNIIFCTGYSDYLYDAFQEVRATGYLYKPVRAEDIANKMQHLHVPLERHEIKKEDIYFRCFGQFEMFYKNEPVVFKNTKTKELLAYLVDRKGAVCSNRQIEVALWDDDGDHRKYLFKLKGDLKETFADLGISNILKLSFGGRGIGILMDKVTCDYYQWLNNEPDGVKAYFGEYMEPYSGWAEETRAVVFAENEKQKYPQRVKSK